MNGFKIIGIKDEHLEQIVKMFAKFGVPSGANHYESVEKLKKYMEEDEKRGKVVLESSSGELVGFIFYCLGYVWPLEAFKREFHRSSEIGYISDIIVHPRLSKERDRQQACESRRSRSCCNGGSQGDFDHKQCKPRCSGFL